MDRYIDRLQVLSTFLAIRLRYERYRNRKNRIAEALYKDVCQAEKWIETMFPLDVAPVRHGHWTSDKFGNLWCSVCKHCGSNDGIATLYCPNCGARMDGGVDDGPR